MSLRVKLLALFSFAALAAVGTMDWGVERYVRRQFQADDQQRIGAQVAQFQQELAQRGQEVLDGVQGIADAESTLRMVLDLNRPQADSSLYRNDARALAEMHSLDYLELAGDDGTLISVAQWPDQVGGKNDWVIRQSDWNQQGAFLDRVELAGGVELGLMAVRIVRVGDHNFYIIGGRRIDRGFLQALALPADMRALLYRNLQNDFVPEALSSAAGPVPEAERFGPFIQSVRAQGGTSETGNSPSQRKQETIQWTSDPVSTEKIDALPLNGRQGELLGILLLGSSQSALIALLNYVHGLALIAAAGALVLGFLMSWWVAARFTLPLSRLASGIDSVASGDWETQIAYGAGGEVAHLLRSFNRMTDSLSAERHRDLTTERVTAWRELAQQLAGEVQSGIAPLQKAVENLGRAREQTSERFDEIFFESLATLRLELRMLQAAGEALVEFSDSPQLHFEPVQLNDIIRAALKTFEPQFCAIGRPPITPEVYLDKNVGPVRADGPRLQKAIENLLYRALVDMPSGGSITVRTKQLDGRAHMVMTDTGRGFEPASPERIISMHPTAGHARTSEEDHLAGEGLLLATVQAIISDHGGKITVESAPGAGTTFSIDLPIFIEAPKSLPESKPKPALPKVARRSLPASSLTPDANLEAPAESTAETAAAQEPDVSTTEPVVAATESAVPLVAESQPMVESQPAADAEPSIEVEAGALTAAAASEDSQVVTEAELGIVAESLAETAPVLVAAGHVDELGERQTELIEAQSPMSVPAPADEIWGMLPPEPDISNSETKEIISLEVEETRLNGGEAQSLSSPEAEEKEEETAPESIETTSEPEQPKTEVWRSPLTYRG